MTALLGLLGSGLGPAGIAALLAVAVVAARAYLGKAGALAVGAAGLLLVAYVAGAHQAGAAAELDAARSSAAAAQAALVEERRQVAAAAAIAAADGRRAIAIEDEAETARARLSELESHLAANPAGACATADDARRLRGL